MIRSAAGGGAKAAAAGLITGQSHQGDGFIGSDPVGVLVVGRIEVMSDQQKCLGITGPDAEYGPW